MKNFIVFLFCYLVTCGTDLTDTYVFVFWIKTELEG